MNDARVMRFRESRGDLDCHIERFGQWQRSFAEARAKCFPLHVFRNHVGDGVASPNVVDDQDVGVVQRRCSFCLLNKASHAVGV